MIDPARYYDNNVGGTAKLLAACATFGCRQTVLSSSCATYGVRTRLRERGREAIPPYGYTKLVAEHMLKDAEAAYQIERAYFNAAGADPEGEFRGGARAGHT